MQKKILIIIIVAVLLLLAAVSAFLILFQKGPFIDTVKDKQRQERLDVLTKEYPDIVDGKITFDGKNAIISTAEDKSYILSPSLAKEIYEQKGIKEGTNVRVYGKYLGNNIIECALITKR